MKNVIIALVLIALGLADLFLKYTGYVWLDLSFIGSGLFLLGLHVFTSILKVIIFSIILLGVTIAVLLGLKVISFDELSIYYEQSKDYIEKNESESSDVML